jgi:hypothetical protein
VLEEGKNKKARRPIGSRHEANDPPSSTPSTTRIRLAMPMSNNAMHQESTKRHQEAPRGTKRRNKDALKIERCTKMHQDAFFEGNACLRRTSRGGSSALGNGATYLLAYLPTLPYLTLLTEHNQKANMLSICTEYVPRSTSLIHLRFSPKACQVPSSPSSSPSFSSVIFYSSPPSHYSRRRTFGTVGHGSHSFVDHQ